MYKLMIYKWDLLEVEPIPEDERLFDREAGLGTVGKGHVRYAERFDEQNCHIQSYKYHCLCASNPFGKISNGN